MRTPEFYDKYQEAEHRPMSDLKREWGTIKHDLDTNPLLTVEERETLERRLKYVAELMSIRKAYEKESRWKREHRKK